MNAKTKRFTIMAAGTKGCGKSQFFNNLVGKEITQKNIPDEINVYMLNLDCEGNMQKISFIDTPGFDTVNDLAVQNNIINYIKEQFDLFMLEETKVRRNPLYEDTRVHCLLYFIPATSCGLKQTDLHFLENIKHLVNIIPVLSKADGLMKSEVKEYKELIRDQFKMYNIPIFDLNNDSLVSVEHTDTKYHEVVPFSIINGYNKIKDINNTQIQVDDPKCCDLSCLREVILSSHLDGFMEITSTILYENYRTKALETALGDKNRENIIE